MLQVQLLTAVLCLSLCLHSACGDVHARRALRQYAGNYKYNSLAGVESEAQTGAIYGTSEQANACLFVRGSINPWNVTAEALVAASGRGSFIAPKKGALVYGPSCLLYDYVCNFNYQEPCNRNGICQTNNTCFCGNGFASCAPSTGLQPLPGTLYGTYASSAGCETDLYNDVYNCGHCGNVCPTALPFCAGGVCAASQAPPPPPVSAAPPPPTAGRRMLETPVDPWEDGQSAGEGGSYLQGNDWGDGSADDLDQEADQPAAAGLRMLDTPLRAWDYGSGVSEDVLSWQDAL
ncbi:hypothetical protein WJX81_005204 [Elliptochloris bilobata]|uniref:Uncharacterized protein n=1 Tax=Elliptochloris bilobata TaxID=381761 RepID=A0AAW1QHS2_9CHLO